MNRKLKNTLALLGVMVGILVLGFAFILIFQQPKIKKKRIELNALKAYDYDTEALREQLKQKIKQAGQLDSILAARKYNIPKGLSPLKFYDFMNALTSSVSPTCQINIEYTEQKTEKNFFYHEYKLNGIGTYNDLFQIIYAIEQSKEMKKILNIGLSNFVRVEDGLEPAYFVSYTLVVGAYFSDNDRFAAVNAIENNLKAQKMYDVFYPQVRTEIPPNLDGLLDVQAARLLAIVPEGAFFSDNKGESFLLLEGDKVYLGYLTEIDKRNNRAKFILNKGGIVESVIIQLDKEIPKTER